MKSTATPSPSDHSGCPRIPPPGVEPAVQAAIPPQHRRPVGDREVRKHRMGHLDGKTVIVTGAGRGIGREHALLFAREGASVVVNELGGAQDGSGSAAGPAHDVVDEITAAGGEAVANGNDVATAEGAQGIVATALSAFGRIDGLVNKD